MGMRLSNINMQLLHAHLTKSKSPTEDLWQTLQLKGEKLMDGDKVLETRQEHMQALETSSKQFNEGMLPLLKALKIA